MMVQPTEVYLVATGGYPKFDPAKPSLPQFADVTIAVR
jgi:hypothetical protein